MGELDLIAECPVTGQKWAVEVRGRKGAKKSPVKWLSRSKIQRLKKLVQVLSVQTRFSYRLLFVQVEIKSVAAPKEFPCGREWKMEITDWELTEAS